MDTSTTTLSPSIHLSPMKKTSGGMADKKSNSEEIQLTPLKHSRLCPNTLNIIDSPAPSNSNDSNQKILAAFDQSVLLDTQYETQSAPTTPLANVKAPIFMLTANAKHRPTSVMNKSDTNNNLSGDAADTTVTCTDNPDKTMTISSSSQSSGGVVSPLAMMQGIFGGCLKPMLQYWGKSADKPLNVVPGLDGTSLIFESVNPSGDASTSSQSAILGNLQTKWMLQKSALGKTTAKSAAAGNAKHDGWVIPMDAMNINPDEVIGSGTHGTVFLAELNGEKVALKRVKLESETRIDHLRRLNHRNIIKLKGITCEAPWYCIIMEYCAQGQLYEVLRRTNVPIGPILMIDWAKQIADGMAYLHQYNTIHRDLKSLNILVDEHNICKISDFDTCRTWNQNSAHMSFCGTAAWMAPEMIHNEPRSFKVDVWSYGVVLWELITRQIPYNDFDSNSVMFGVGNGTLSLPVPSSIPEGLKLLLRQCWSLKPRNRPSFPHIMKHLEIALTEVQSYSNQEWERLQQHWGDEIGNHFNNLRTNRPKKEKNQTVFSQAEEELLRRRREELNHAKDVRKLYEDKLRRVTELDSQLMDFMYHYDQQKRELDHRERAFVQILRSYGYPNMTNMTTRPSHSRTRTRATTHRISKQLVMRAGPKMLAGMTDQAANTDVCSSVTNAAILECPSNQPAVHGHHHRLGVASSSSSDDDENVSHVATIQSSSSGLSPMCPAFGASEVRKSTSNRKLSTTPTSNTPNSSRRPSMSCRASPGRLSTSDRFSRDSSARGSGCSTGRSDHSGLWVRASPYRVSGSSAISADSGVHGMMSPTESMADMHYGRDDSSELSSGTFSRNSCRHSSLTQPRLYRNEVGRWSDGRIRQLHQATMFGPTVPNTLSRDQPSRNAVPRHRKSTSRSHSRHNLSASAVGAAEHKIKRKTSPNVRAKSSSRKGSQANLQEMVIDNVQGVGDKNNNNRRHSASRCAHSGSLGTLQAQSDEVCLGCQGECSDPNCNSRVCASNRQSPRHNTDANCNPIACRGMAMTHSSSYQEALKCGSLPTNGGSNQSPNMISRFRQLVGHENRSVHSDPDMRHYRNDNGWNCGSEGSDDDSLSSNTDSEKENDLDSSMNMSESLTASTLRRDIMAATSTCEHDVLAQRAQDRMHTVTFRTHQPITSEEEISSERSSRESGNLALLAAAAASMDCSQSTMASSLERSLELGAFHSDGLSDKECRVRAVKQLIGHRRTSSHPNSGLPIPALITESTTSDSDCDIHHPVHC